MELLLMTGSAGMKTDYRLSGRPTQGLPVVFLAVHCRGFHCGEALPDLREFF